MRHYYPYTVCGNTQTTNKGPEPIANPITADGPTPVDAPSDDKKVYYNKQDDVVVNTTHRYYLTGGINWECDWYHPLLQTLDNAKPTETIEIHLNNYGGALYAANQLVNSIQRTKGKTRIIVTGICASAATIVLLGADYDEYIIDDFSQFLFHTGSTFLYGKFNELKDDADFANYAMEKMYNVYFEDILSDEELEQVICGKELWLLGSDVRERLLKRIELRQREVEREEKKKAKKAK